MTAKKAHKPVEVPVDDRRRPEGLEVVGFRSAPVEKGLELVIDGGGSAVLLPEVEPFALERCDCRPVDEIPPKDLTDGALTDQDGTCIEIEALVPILLLINSAALGLHIALLGALCVPRGCCWKYCIGIDVYR